MPAVSIDLPGSSAKLTCRRLAGTERLGQWTELEIEAFSQEPVDASSVLAKDCVVVLENECGGRALRGTVVRFGAVATAQAAQGRVYRFCVRSALAPLVHRRRSRIFQHMTVPDIVEKVLADGGAYDGDAFEDATKGTHEEREYVVQYDETDADFVRRLCEDDGLFFKFEAATSGEKLVLLDTSKGTEPTLASAVRIIDAVSPGSTNPYAVDVTLMLQRRVGKVTLRDYDPGKPSLPLEGVAQGGTKLEASTEVYLAPGGFRTKAKGQDRAALALEARRADAITVGFRTNALQLAPGDAFDMEPGAAYTGSANLTGRYYVVSVTHDWSYEGQHRENCFPRIEAIPIETAFRLRPCTPRPRIAGLHSAQVTGATGAEIHPDADGSIFVRFGWDRDGPTDHKSSRPIRVAQPNTPGSMVIPRVGWEVFVAFEDGDPDRPYVVGKTFNGKQVPPFPLPANKTVTALQTRSSPGGAGQHSIHFDDAAGSQHVRIDATFAKTTNVANDMHTETAKVEVHTVGANLTCDVGGEESVSVTEALIIQVGSQHASVGGVQNIHVEGTQTTKTGSELVAIGGALLEHVGDPVSGALNLLKAAALAGVGMLGDKLGEIGKLGVLGKVASKAVGWGLKLGPVAYDMYEAAEKPGAKPGAAREKGLNGLLEIGAGMIPGGESILASAESMGIKPPWEKEEKKEGEKAEGGGAEGESDNTAADKGGAGKRETKVTGPMAELIGGGSVVSTPGPIKWQATGASVVLVGANHTTKAVKVAQEVMGASMETLGSFHVKTDKDVGRDVKGAVKTTIAGDYSAKTTGGKMELTAETSVKLTTSGALTLAGGKVSFEVGDSVLSSSSGGVLIKASTITIKGASSQKGAATHQ